MYYANAYTNAMTNPIEETVITPPPTYCPEPTYYAGYYSSQPLPSEPVVLPPSGPAHDPGYPAGDTTQIA